MTRLLDSVRSWLQPWRSGPEPMEIRKAVLEEVEDAVVAVGGGKRLFPFDRLRVDLLAEDPRQRAVLEAAAREGWDLEREIPERLRALGASFPPGLRIEVRCPGDVPAERGDRRFEITYERAGAGPSATPPALRLTVEKGKATQKAYTFHAHRVDVGRLPEVLDRDGRVKRRNDVAFLEDGKLERTVSREHARIDRDERSGEYRIRDQQSALGTRIWRDGRSIEVSSRDRRGIRLEPGDEVYFGQACVKVAFLPPESERPS